MMGAIDREGMRKMVEARLVVQVSRRQKRVNFFFLGPVAEYRSCDAVLLRKSRATLTGERGSFCMQDKV